LPCLTNACGERQNDTPGDVYMTSLLEKTTAHAHTYDAPERGWYAAAAAGTLPHLSWIVPRYGSRPNDDHPCHDLALGEALLKDVYETLRASPQWNRSALFVIYDDAGGFFDHVPPPTGVPPPDAKCDVGPGCPNAFAFDRLGIRLANLLVSPLLPKGSVLHDPAGPPGTPTRPANNSVYEMSSIAATIKNLFNLSSFLTRRDAWA
jgi:phospholipase C